MTKAHLTNLTVKQLRQLCGERGLPKYQRKNKRLRKADLVRQLVEQNRGTVLGVHCRNGNARYHRSNAGNPASAIIATLSTLDMTPAERSAFRRLFAGATDQKYDTIMRTRELRAVAVLRDGATTESERRMWADQYVRRAAGV